MTTPVPAPIGHNDQDREALARAAAWCSAHVRDDALEISVLLDGLDSSRPLEVFDLARAMVELVAALHAQVPAEVEQLLGETRRRNLPRFE
ncbi:hypothetical protein [Intrasporangium calvum]|uniref:Uncharacterized protein n=1 Tax=Intrasporangium calvum (strain ATCC 23552 / DSM 43043 / JCM 3097 / NBRC 12989 / NCIMB 10167 / NRRL B-3866 / 7 KIP) TaxID=710696 RepID=E6S908_INTC7|nr:hypothetical protein [Intrasporangium calvum]ADU49183.1 hypothetical protein Intca_2681 [Intrasporangium calvum DSM 43043]